MFFNVTAVLRTQYIRHLYATPTLTFRRCEQALSYTSKLFFDNTDNEAKLYNYIFYVDLFSSQNLSSLTLGLLQTIQVALSGEEVY